VRDPRAVLTRLLPPGAADAVEQLVAEEVGEQVPAAVREAVAAEHARELLTLDEAAVLLGCSRDAVRMRARRGRLDTRRHGRRVYVTRESLRKLEGP
jgi:excisionase family DNA binding protein